jgi:endo-1,4-beta-xylanase
MSSTGGTGSGDRGSGGAAAASGGATGGGGVFGSGGAPGGGSGGAPGGSGGNAGGASGSGGRSGSGGLAAASGGNGGGAGMGGAGGAGTGGKISGTGGGGGAPNLRDKYAAYFPIGAAVNATTYTTHAPILTKHFNSVTCEDEMKFDALEPTENNFTYAAADKIVAFAMTNNMKVRGHTLVWHNQNPSWLFVNSSGGDVTKDVLLSRMRNHITNVVKHFKGKVYAWDVVNEAVMPDGTLRTGNEATSDQNSNWYRIAGDSYIAEAYKAAHDADPDAKLFYNDYYDYLPAKHQGIHDLLQKLLAAGVTVNGVGMQTHINIEPSTDMTNQGYYQTVSNLEDAINLYASLGLDVQVTEMDVSLYIPGVTYTAATYYTAATFTDALKTEQADRYAAFFELFRKHRDVITGVTIWGIADDSTWLSRFSSGRMDFPLLFDTAHQPKKAFYSVVNF